MRLDLPLWLRRYSALSPPKAVYSWARKDSTLLDRGVLMRVAPTSNRRFGQHSLFRQLHPRNTRWADGKAGEGTWGLSIAGKQVMPQTSLFDKLDVRKLLGCTVPAIVSSYFQLYHSKITSVTTSRCSIHELATFFLHLSSSFASQQTTPSTSFFLH
jgi:hypothetical protein